MENYISKEYLIKRINVIVKDALSFKKGEMYYNVIINKGKLICLMELLHELDPEYILDKNTQKYLAEILNQTYKAFPVENEGE